MPPAELTAHHTELVKQADHIVLARVVGRDHQFWRKRRRAIFETVEILKGSSPPSFSLPNGFVASSDDEDMGDFNGHWDSIFWDRRVTRQWNSSDCRMNPDFVMDRTYLLFVDRPHWRAYEEIQSPDDLWLEAVRNLIDDPSLPSGISMTVKEWLSLAQGVFLGRIKSCEGPTLTVDEILHGDVAGDWRYAKASGVSHWPERPCLVGQKFLVVTHYEEPLPLPYYSSGVFPVVDGEVDFTSAFEDSEIDIVGVALNKVSGLRERLRGEAE